MRVHVEAVGVLAPGFPDWPAAQAVLAGAATFHAAPLASPAPHSLAGAERRRSSPAVRLAMAAAEQAMRRTGRTPQDMVMVFSSREGCGEITHQLCEVLTGGREVSPTQFHNSVHNAPSGYYSIATGAKLAADSVCHGPWSFAAGLLDAAVRVQTDGAAVLYVCHDSPMPSPLFDAMPIAESTAIALVLAPAAGLSTLATWEIALAAHDAPAPWPDWMPATWHANASARGFAALALLADPAQRITMLPLSAELDLQVARC
jgi:hypothetical protein